MHFCGCKGSKYKRLKIEKFNTVFLLFNLTFTAPQYLIANLEQHLLFLDLAVVTGFSLQSFLQEKSKKGFPLQSMLYQNLVHE
jgi:predicted neutral ceramidase superfamily lipid hydrolase